MRPTSRSPSPPISLRKKGHDSSKLLPKRRLDQLATGLKVWTECGSGGYVPRPSPASSSGVSSGVDALKELAAEAPVAVFLLLASRMPLSLAA